MNDAAASEQDRPEGVQYEPAEGIMYGPLPVLGNVVTIPMAVTMGGAVVVMFVLYNQIRGVSTTTGVTVGEVLAGMLVMISVASALRERTINRARRASISRKRTTSGQNGLVQLTLVETFFDLERRRSLLARRNTERWSWSDLTSQLAARRLRPARCVADVMLQERLARIDLPANMLEPEMISPGTPASRRTTIACLVVFGCNAFIAVMSRRWWSMFFLLVAAGSLIVAFPGFRRQFPSLAERARSPVAGLGAIRDFEGRTWTINDSILLVTTKDAMSALLVSIVGPPGWLRMFFMNESDPEFIKLWQRWNHPHPRPELLE